jgi:hypothetical protein
MATYVVKPVDAILTSRVLEPNPGPRLPAIADKSTQRGTVVSVSVAGD